VPVGHPRLSVALYALAGLGIASLGVEALALRRLRRRHLTESGSFPACSVLKPLSGRHPELERDLESHAAVDYPGDWELVLGVESADDEAAEAAAEFVRRHHERARLLICGERLGTNGKVSQLIELSRAARHDVLVCTDANVRIYPRYLRDVAAGLEQPSVGLVTHMVAGVGERRAGAAFDNQAWLAFVAPNVAMAATLGMDQVVGKSLALKREVLDRLGGWEPVKDVLGEDQQLGSRLAALGLRSHVCATPVQQVQTDASVADFWTRQTRWAMIRFRLLPGFILEPLLNPILFSGLALAVARRKKPALMITGSIWALAMLLAQVFAGLLRGRGFRARHLALFPVQQLLLFLAWGRGATRRTLVWHGRSFQLGRGGTLTPLQKHPAR
jgi:ceramide glucosyltransferase